jgi:hypothetical protein
MSRVDNHLELFCVTYGSFVHETWFETEFISCNESDKIEYYYQCNCNMKIK